MKNSSGMGTMLVRISGDRMLIAVFGDEVDPAVNERVRRMAALVTALQHPAIEAVVSAFELGLMRTMILSPAAGAASCAEAAKGASAPRRHPASIAERRAEGLR